MVCTLHKASEAISLVLSPSLSKVLIKICCAAFSCGAMIVADTKALTNSPSARSAQGSSVPLVYNRGKVSEAVTMPI
jgi:hypothetical protein